MKSLYRLSLLCVASATMVFASGCAKKPLRPNPSQTYMGSGPGGSTLDTTGVPLFEDNESAIPGHNPQAGPENQHRGMLPSVFFAFDSAAIAPAERAKLDQAAAYVKSNPGTGLLLEGHCDWRGTTEYNMGLGDRRARAVRDYLVRLGVPAASLETVSKGDLEAKEGASAAEMQQDRRVEVIVLM